MHTHAYLQSIIFMGSILIDSSYLVKFTCSLKTSTLKSLACFFLVIVVIACLFLPDIHRHSQSQTI